MASSETSSPVPMAPRGSDGFSIRAYVHEARKKCVACNWPFSVKYLELCTKHDVIEILPPFEPWVINTESVQLPSANQEISWDLHGALNQVQHPCVTADVNAKVQESFESHGHKDELIVSSTDREFMEALEKSPALREKWTEKSADTKDLWMAQSIGAGDCSEFYVHQKLASDDSSLTSNSGPCCNEWTNGKPKRRNRRAKKRSMEDILERAKPVTLEFVESRNVFGFNQC